LLVFFKKIGLGTLQNYSIEEKNLLPPSTPFYLPFKSRTQKVLLGGAKIKKLLSERAPDGVNYDVVGRER
jgi:hypothetical protein